MPKTPCFLALPLHLRDSYGELNENQVEGSTQVYVVALMLEREEGKPFKRFVRAAYPFQLFQKTKSKSGGLSSASYQLRTC